VASSSKVFAAAVLLIAACLAPCMIQAQEKWQGAEAPLFARQSIAGKEVRLEELRGNVVLLNFWATWCAPCLFEMPTFEKWQKQYGATGLRVVGVSMDDDPAVARKMVAQLKVSYPVVMADASLVELYGKLSESGGVLGLPLSYLIDRDGRVVAKFDGETHADKIEGEISRLLLK